MSTDIFEEFKSFTYRNCGKLLFFPLQIIIHLLKLSHVVYYYDNYVISLFFNLVSYIGYNKTRYDVLFIHIGLFWFFNYKFFRLIKKNHKKHTLILILFVFFVILCQFLSTLFFIDWVELCNTEYNSDFGVVGIFIFPFNFIVLLFIAYYFDKVKNSR